MAFWRITAKVKVGIRKCEQRCSGGRRTSAAPQRLVSRGVKHHQDGKVSVPDCESGLSSWASGGSYGFLSQDRTREDIMKGEKEKGSKSSLSVSSVYIRVREGFQQSWKTIPDAKSGQNGYLEPGQKTGDITVPRKLYPHLDICRYPACTRGRGWPSLMDQDGPNLSLRKKIPFLFTPNPRILPPQPWFLLCALTDRCQWPGLVLLVTTSALSALPRYWMLEPRGMKLSRASQGLPEQCNDRKVTDGGDAGRRVLLRDPETRSIQLLTIHKVQNSHCCLKSFPNMRFWLPPLRLRWPVAVTSPWILESHPLQHSCQPLECHNQDSETGDEGGIDLHLGAWPLNAGGKADSGPWSMSWTSWQPLVEYEAWVFIQTIAEALYFQGQICS